MATTKQPSDAKLTFIKISRVLTYLVYAYTVIAVSFLLCAFALQLFNASTQSSFVRFVYNTADQFLSPFRGIFPGRTLSTGSYFNASALFAVIMYSIFASALHALINYITAKMYHYQNMLIAEQRHSYETSTRPAGTTQKPASTTQRPPATTASSSQRPRNI